ncbi:MAG: hypothetical protein AB4040_05470 [Synechococcus sp.]
MQEQDIQALLTHAVEQWQVELQVTVHDRHLHVLVTRPNPISTEIEHLLAEETQTFLPHIDRMTFWFPAAGEQPKQHSTIDLAQPVNPESVDLTQFRFVSNSSLLAIDLPPPPMQVVKAVLYVHKLEEVERSILLSLLKEFFDRPDKFATESIPSPHQPWLEELRSLRLEWFRGVAVWLSRYCHNPNRALPELEQALAAGQIVSPTPRTQYAASDTNNLGGAAPVASRLEEPALEDRAAVGNLAAIARSIDLALAPWRPFTRASLHHCASTDRDELRLQVTAVNTPEKRGTTAMVFLACQSLRLPATHVKIYGLANDRSVQWKSEFDLEGDRAISPEYNRFSFNNPWVNVAAVPAAMVLAMLANTIVPILMYPLQVWIHEFGHATIAWMAGYRATPLPFGWTNVSSDRSLFVYVGGLFLLGLLFHAGWREQKRWPMVLAVSLVILQAYMTWILPERMFDMLMSFGGIGGEFYLSTLLIVSFYFKMPDRFRWDFWRFLILFVSASAFCHAFWQWHLIDRGLQDIPWGTIFGGSGDAGGDMDRLNWTHGWSATRIIDTYNRLGELCLLTIVGTYGFFAIKLNPRVWFGIQQQAISWWFREGPGRKPSAK